MPLKYAKFHIDWFLSDLMRRDRMDRQTGIRGLVLSMNPKGG